MRKRNFLSIKYTHRREIFHAPPGIYMHSEPLNRGILFLTTTLDNLNRFYSFFISFWSWRNYTCDCIKIYHITLIVCAPYFVNLNNNTFRLKTLLFFVHLRLQRKRTEKVIYDYLFEVFRALEGSVEWSGVTGVDSKIIEIQLQSNVHCYVLWITAKCV